MSSFTRHSGFTALTETIYLFGLGSGKGRMPL
jgi:hypothetical protein